MLIDIEYTRFKKHLTFRKVGHQTEVFDPIRRKYIILQPEELVRQLVLQYLNIEKNYPLSRMRVELGLTVNELSKRCDILIFDKNAQPYLLVECKSIHVPVDQTVFDQIARYNLKFKVPYLITTNGLSTFCCKMNYVENLFENTISTDGSSYEFLKDIPFFQT
jgi:Type I restriction enzyme R protein N terminus (HSDR_N)